MLNSAKLIIMFCCLSVAAPAISGTASPVTGPFGVPTYFNKLKVKEGVIVGPNQEEIPLQNGYSIIYEQLIADLTAIVDSKIPSSSPRGYLTGLLPRYLDADEISWSGGALDIDGATYNLESTVAVDMVACLGGTFANDTWYYVYLDPPLGSRTLGAGDFEVSATGPQFQAAKSGWYHPTNANWRCLGVFKTSSGGQIIPFSGDGAWFMFSDPVCVLSTAAPATTLTGLGVGLPGALESHVQVSLQGYVQLAGTNDAALLVGHGDTTTTMGPPTILARQNVAGSDHEGQGVFMTNALGQVTYWATGNALSIIFLRGFRLPCGLAR